MARTALPIVSVVGSYPTLPLGVGAAAFVFTAADNVNGNSFVATGREILLVQNSDSVAQTITIHSAVDSPYNRSGDITTYSLAAGTFAGPFGPFLLPGWLQSDGTVWLDTSAATIKFCVVHLPSLS